MLSYENPSLMKEFQEVNLGGGHDFVHLHTKKVTSFTIFRDKLTRNWKMMVVMMMIITIIIIMEYERKIYPK